MSETDIRMYVVDGHQLRGEQAVRNYCINYTRAGFKQDFRLANGARKMSLQQLIELLERTGHSVEILDQ